MSILQNAVDSIQLGIEDFEAKNPKRLPSPVRNFFAGVLLLFKSKLADLSSNDDEALIKQTVLPVIEDGKIIWKGQGKKTVDFHQIEIRLESLNIDVDWKKLVAIQDYRNDIEHYHTDVKPETVRQYLVDGFVIVRDFIDRHLGKSPRELLGDDTWSTLIEYEAVYEAEAKSCVEKMAALEWTNDAAHHWIKAAQCDRCDSRLIRPRSSAGTEAAQSDFECSVCGKSWSCEDLLEITGCPSYTHQAAREGMDDPVGQCPKCGNMGYDDIERQCVYCGESGPYICKRCENVIPTIDLSWDGPGYCGYCNHMMSKDD